MFTDYDEKDDSKEEIKGLKKFLLGYALFITLVLPIIWFIRCIPNLILLLKFKPDARKIVRKLYRKKTRNFRLSF
ncbi:MAG: hypothetical protein ABH830_01690 [Patescibacteria group bacterium]